MSIEARVARLDWQSIARDLDTHGHAVTKPLLRAGECRSLRALYTEDSRFRSTIVMGPRRYGEGEYRYFANPLPDLVSTLRETFYPHLAEIANRWAETLGEDARFPGTLAGLRALCHANGQTRPTPLLLRYEAEGYNCLHQDLYGDIHFPLQVACLLSRPERDFSGGEFLLVEQRPRAQSVGHAIALEQGACVVFPVRDRPIPSKRGFTRARVRHGVSRIHGGHRMTLGLIFHDAH